MKETVATQNYTAVEDITGLYQSNTELFLEGSPDFMNDVRGKALDDFVRQGIPSTKDENYKYTDLRPVFEGDFNVFPSYVDQEIDFLSLFKCDVPKLDTFVILTVNGWYYQRNRNLDLPEGVIIGSLAQAAREHPELVAQYYGKQVKTGKDPLAALNTLLAKDGLFIYVPDNIVIEKPLQVINLLRAKNDSFSTQRNLFIVGKNSQLKVVFCDHTLSKKKFVSNKLTEIYVQENAVFDFYNIQNQHNESANLNSTFICQKASSNIQINTASLHGGVVRNNLEVLLNGEYAEANVYGISLTDNKQHVDNYTHVDHAKPNCTSNQLFKNVLDEESTGAFAGRIHVWRDAQKTVAFQRNNNVLMSANAKIDTKPQLVIDANDVKCSHGATVGRIDTEALFYLRARGISEKEAKLLLMFAFVHEVIAQIRVKPLQERLDELVDKRFRGEISKCHKCMFDCNPKSLK
ncbi:MAG: Fe-S cluster assembly protein SufD [Bacteroidota bacterium]|nr:Fe-S cluster assembly protein SufD [Bacteroidota bacterium]MDP4205195.1 Fe-S cluster assembly protein SufD [Bacteroidota bacterium]